MPRVSGLRRGASGRLARARRTYDRRVIEDSHIPASQSLIPDPLGTPSAEFVAAASGQVRVGRLGGRDGALAAYRAVFRENRRDIEGVRVEVAPIVKMQREDSPEGEVIKFVQRLSSGRAAPALANRPLDIESVLIPMIGSKRQLAYTLCVSSQVGCAMNCGFCETAQMGLVRSLTPAEIVGQWFAATHEVGIRPSNIVFMGMGEPLDNYDAVVRAIGVLIDHNGPHVPASKVTVSTVGRVDGIRKLAEQVRAPGWHRLGLAFSLNAPNDEVRSTLMPVNKRWNLDAVRRELLAWPRYAGNKLCIEYVLIPGVNDSEEHAAQVAEFIRPFGLIEGDRISGSKLFAVLNLIPYNPRRESPWPAPSEAQVEQFLGWLVGHGVFAKRRRTKGRQMMGACGQLGTPEIRGRRPVMPTISA